MSSIPTRLAEARQFLSAAGWTVEEQHDNDRTTYVVVDKQGVPRRSFVPVDRLWDYTRGVFDAQDFDDLR